MKHWMTALVAAALVMGCAKGSSTSAMKDDETMVSSTSTTNKDPVVAGYKMTIAYYNLKAAQLLAEFMDLADAAQAGESLAAACSKGRELIEFSQFWQQASADPKLQGAGYVNFNTLFSEILSGSSKMYADIGCHD
jgi:hypothetical protein